MKYISIVLLFITFPFSLSYANFSTSVDVTPTEVDLWEYIIFNIEITWTELSWEIDTNIEWLQDFQVFSRSQRMRFQSINWEIESSMIIRLQLEPISSWIFTLGPTTIAIDGEILTDDTEIQVQVWTHIQPDREDHNTASNTINPNPSQLIEWELYGIIKENTFTQLMYRLILYIIIISILSIVLSQVFKRLQKTNRSAQSKPITYEIVEEKSIYEKYFWMLRSTDESQIFIKKYLRASEKYFTDHSSIRQTYTSLTLDEIRQFTSFQTYPLKNDFEILYRDYYSWKILSDEEKQMYINNIKQRLGSWWYER